MSRNGKCPKTVTHAGPEQPFRCLDYKLNGYISFFLKAAGGRSHAGEKMVFCFRDEKKRNAGVRLIIPPISKNFGHACVRGK